jgi:hypothetical protein
MSETTPQKRAAIHEASHIIIGFRHGYFESWGKIYQTEFCGFKFWVGETTIAPSNESVWKSVGGVEFGLAGCIGEAILDGRDDYTAVDFWYDQGPDVDHMSASDWECAGIDYEDFDFTPEFLQAAKSVGDYLKEHWSDVRRISRRLIKEARLPRDKIRRAMVLYQRQRAEDQRLAALAE